MQKNYGLPMEKPTVVCKRMINTKAYIFKFPIGDKLNNIPLSSFSMSHQPAGKNENKLSTQQGVITVL